MGGTASLIGSVFTGLSTLMGMSDNSDALKEEQEAREREQAREEAEDRRRDREKVLEARELEARRESESTLSNGAASLTDAPEVSAAGLKTRLGE